MASLFGPWAFVLLLFEQDRPLCMYFGRDPFGRRSLLYATPAALEAKTDCTAPAGTERKAFLLSFVAFPITSISQRGSLAEDVTAQSSESGGLEPSCVFPFHELVPAGVYCLRFGQCAQTGTTKDDATAFLSGFGGSCYWTVTRESWPWLRSSPATAPVARRYGHAARLHGSLDPLTQVRARVAAIEALAEACSEGIAAVPIPAFSSEHVAGAALALLRQLARAVAVRTQNVSRCPSGSKARVSFEVEHPTAMQIPATAQLSSLVHQMLFAANEETAMRTSSGLSMPVSISAAIQGFSVALQKHHPIALTHQPASVPASPCAMHSSVVEVSPSTSFNELRLLPSNAVRYVRSVIEIQNHPPSEEAKSDHATGSGASVAILFSGGLDSMVLAALAHHSTPTDEPIDLINVCFAPGHASPDRLAAIAGTAELRKLYSQRTWQLICADEAFSAAFSAEAQTRTVRLLSPALSHMDFNIGSALWTAARGIGYVDVEIVGKCSTTEGAAGNQELDVIASLPGSAAPKGGLRYGNLADHSSAKPKRKGGKEKVSQRATAVASNNVQIGTEPVVATTSEPVVAASLHSHEAVTGLIPPERVRSVLSDAATQTATVVDEALPSAIADACSWFDDELSSVAAAIGIDISKIVLNAGPEGAAAKSSAMPAASVAQNQKAGSSKNPEPPVVSVMHKSAVKNRERNCKGVGGDGTRCDVAKDKACAKEMCSKCCALYSARESRDALAAGDMVKAAAARSVCSFHHQPASLEPIDVAASTALASEGEPTCCPELLPGSYRVLIRSTARVLLLGIGADEQMGGYGRHKSCYVARGFAGLQDELAMDTARLWKRNLGRDDRVCSDHGREVRLPFLDEGVAAFLRSLPLPLVTDPRLGPGVGDKRILRVVARMLGLMGSSYLVKRAIHFGCRIAKQSNIQSFGSNSAGKGDSGFLFALAADGESEP
jgi:hypothetical protein